jgi:hypothetical protein
MEGNLKIEFKEIGHEEDMDLIHLAQDRDLWQVLVNILMNLWVPLKVGNFYIN